MLEGSIQSREIIAGKGHGSMDALELHYGVGNTNQIQNIIVRWPSKDTYSNQQKVSVYEGPFEVNKTYKIVEDLGFVGFKGDMNLDLTVNILDVVTVVNYIFDDMFLLFSPCIQSIVDIVQVVNIIFSDAESFQNNFGITE